MHDSILNPFTQFSDENNFLSVSKTYWDIDAFRTVDKIFAIISFDIDKKVQIMSRQRLSFWQALGDVGGFHDGLILLIKLFMVPLSASFFNFDWTKGRYYYSSQPSRASARKI